MAFPPRIQSFLGRLGTWDTIVGLWDKYVWVRRLITSSGVAGAFMVWVKQSMPTIQLPFLVLSGVAAAVAGLMLWNAITHRRLQMAGSQIKSGAVAQTDQPVVAAAAQLNATYIQGQPFRLVDIPRHNGVIEGKTFENCTIYGPAVVVPIEGNAFYDSGWSIYEKPASILWETSYHQLLGCIALRNCTFRQCRFIGIGIGGPRKSLDHFVRKVLGATP